MQYCCICTSSAQRLRDLDLFINKTLSIKWSSYDKILTLSIIKMYWWHDRSKYFWDSRITSYYSPDNSKQCEPYTDAALTTLQIKRAAKETILDLYSWLITVWQYQLWKLSKSWNFFSQKEYKFRGTITRGLFHDK